VSTRPAASSTATTGSTALSAMGVVVCFRFHHDISGPAARPTVPGASAGGPPWDAAIGGQLVGDVLPSTSRSSAAASSSATSSRPVAVEPRGRRPPPPRAPRPAPAELAAPAHT
jgi:hypothetical protein